MRLQVNLQASIGKVPSVRIGVIVNIPLSYRFEWHMIIICLLLAGTVIRMARTPCLGAFFCGMEMEGVVSRNTPPPRLGRRASATRKQLRDQHTTGLAAKAGERACAVQFRCLAKEKVAVTHAGIETE